MPFCSHFSLTNVHTQPVFFPPTFSFHFLLSPQWNKHSIKVSSCSMEGTVNRKDPSSLQEGCVSTPETCPHGSRSLLSCFVMERTPCWHFSVKHTAWRRPFENHRRCRGTALPSGQRLYWISEHPKREQTVQLKKLTCYTGCADSINGCHVFIATSCDYLRTASFILHKGKIWEFLLGKNTEELNYKCVEMYNVFEKGFSWR